MSLNFDELEETKNFLPKFVDILLENADGDFSAVANLFENFSKSKDMEIKMMKEGIRIPKALIISVTIKCNLNCTGCYSRGRQADKELSLEEIDRLINEAKALGIFLFLISGGEPFLKDSILDVLCSHNDVLFWIFTNGTLFDKTLADSIKKCKNIFPFFSIEGFKKETDNWRGQGTYDKLMSAMHLSKERNMQFGFSTVLTNRNINTVTQDKFIESMIKEGCKAGIFLDYKHIDRNLPDSFSCSEEKKSYVKNAVDKYSKKDDILLVHQDSWEMIEGGCCGYGRGILHINSEGFIEPCPMARIPGDNIREKTLKDILKEKSFLKMWQSQSLTGDPAGPPCINH